MNMPNSMVVSDPLAKFSREGMLKLVAPAKTNLFLGIGERLESGYHEVTTVMHALTLHDVIHMDYKEESSGGLTIQIECCPREGLPDLNIEAKDNIAFKAVRLLAEKLGRTADETVQIRIEKHIPHQAGLGGGSSDAAAALVGAAHFWGIDRQAPEVVAVAAELGSDISFFLHGGCVCLTGMGEVYSHKLEPMKKPLVLIKPEAGVSTALAYQRFDEAPVEIPEALATEALTAFRAEDVPLFNNLTQAAELVLPELAEIRDWVQDQEGITAVLLSGSGSATLAQCETFDDACRISSAAQARGWTTRATTFSSLRAEVVPKGRFQGA